MAQFLSLTSTLPLDVLRLIFEYAVVADRRTGVALATVSKKVKHWVEPILYSVINLHRPHTKLLFLRTIETSKTKKPLFFATSVKTLCIAHDPSSDVYQTTRIISACPGVVNLTFLSIQVEQKPRVAFGPLCATQNPGSPGFKFGLSFDSLSPSCGKFVRDQTALILRRQNAMGLITALVGLKPTHVSTLLPIMEPKVFPRGAGDTGLSRLDERPGPVSLPISLNLHLLLHTTHLSIQNNWEDWVSWASYFDFARLHHLTHLSLDLRAGFSTPRSKMTNQNDAVFPEMDSHDTERACIMARAAQCILTQCPRLRVCALRLIFDSNPDRTATAILAQMPLSKHFSSKAAVEAAKVTNKPVKREDVEMVDDDDEGSDDGDNDNENDDNDDGDDDDDDDDEVIVDMVDPRLVFLWDREPFQERESHSRKEHQMWVKAEEAVERQSVGLGHIVISV